MDPHGQIPLFDPASEEASGPGVGAAVAPPHVAATARSLSRGIHLGTSSWAFPGWAGIVYDRPAARRVLARSGLAAYARHPLLRSVGLDRTYYAPLAAGDFRRYASQVPGDFRFVVKAHELLTVAHFPRHARHGGRGGQRNDLFLHAPHACEAVVAPMLEGLGEKAGALVFQFPPQPPESAGGPAGFAERLQAFLFALPPGPVYAVEIRTPEWLTPHYGQALTAAGAAHCFTVHPRMPCLAEQARHVEPGPAVVIRWMLGGGQRYESARARYDPFDQLVDEDPASRSSIASLCLLAAADARPAFAIVNNKAEGSAPRSVMRLAERIVELAGDDGDRGRTGPPLAG